MKSAGMPLRYIVWLSLKNLWSRKLRTVLTSGAVTLGVGSVIFLLSLGIGLQQLIVNQVASLESLYNLTVTGGSAKAVRLNDEALSKIASFADVSGVEPVVNLSVKMQYGQSASEAVAYGVSKRYLQESGIPILFGSRDSFGDSDSAMVNKSVLRLLGLPQDTSSLGKAVDIGYHSVLPASDLPAGAAQPTTFHIRAIVDDDRAPVLYLPFTGVRPYASESYASVLVRINDRTDSSVAALRAQVEGLGLKTEYVGDTIAQINQIFSTFKLFLGAFGLVALLISVLGMFNTLTVILLEKTREVGFMKVVGVRRRDIQLIFIVEALLLSLFGGVAGIILAWGGGSLLNAVVGYYAAKAGNPGISLFATPLSLVTWVGLLTLLIGLAVGIFPARRAAKIDPLDALRYE
jgi:ABC-type antimicrobial peptide transport system permease subunit